MIESKLLTIHCVSTSNVVVRGIDPELRDYLVSMPPLRDRDLMISTWFENVYKEITDTVI